jgi:hypothetical protein
VGGWGWGWMTLNFALIDHGDLKVGHTPEVECAVSHDAMLVFNARQAMVDSKILNMEKGFSETIVNIMVEAALKIYKKQEQIPPCFLRSITPRTGNESRLVGLYTPALGSSDMAIILVQKLLQYQTGKTKIEKRLS